MVKLYLFFINCDFIYTDMFPSKITDTEILLIYI